MTREVWICVAADEDGEVYFSGTGNTAEAAIKAMYEDARELYEQRAEEGDPPVTIDDAKQKVDEQLSIIQPFLVIVKG